MLQPASLVCSHDLAVQALRCSCAVSPPARGSGANDVGGVYDEHQFRLPAVAQMVDCQLLNAAQYSATSPSANWWRPCSMSGFPAASAGATARTRTSAAVGPLIRW